MLNEFFGIVMFLVTTLGANFWNTNEWCMLYQNLSHRMLLSLEIYEVTKSITESYCSINKSLFDLKIKGVFNGKVKILKFMEEQYHDIVQIVNHFNSVFGWSILAVIFNNGVFLLSTFRFITSIETKDLNENYMRALYMVNAVFTFVWPVIIIFSCDFTKNEAQKILINCSSLHKTMLLPEEVLALNSFENKVYTNLPKFTAAGFFEITRNTLLQFISSLTSYLIILIQLR
ncbi:uncharacterized protein [Diabrotica undecimpunctata]|uniref:uncharacterized protein n=1 Tax=Diabrotica undecimpunctata TaxID=50387 RepID=UPI003B633515